MLQAKIFKASETAVNGETVTIAQLTASVNTFNGNVSSNLVMFDDYPGRSPVVQMDRVAGTAKLHMDGEYVIATVTLLDTPMGRIATQLHEAGVAVQVAPVTTTVPDPAGKMHNLQIRQLVIPNSPAFVPSDTPLRKVQAWVDGVEYWPMFALKENKY